MAIDVLGPAEQTGREQDSRDVEAKRPALSGKQVW